jgi:HK97 family phage major capsid protein
MNEDELRKKIEGLKSEIKAMVDAASAESRDLSEEEDTLIASNFSVIEASQKELNRVQTRNEILAKCEPILAKTIPSAPVATEPARVRIPARAKVHSKLKAFDSAEDAYLSGQFMFAALFNNAKAKQFCRDNGIFNATMVTGDNTLGGFLVPEPMEASIIRLREQYGVFRSNARQVTMADGSMIIPKLASDITSYFVGENQAITDSTPGLQQIRLDAKKLAAMTLFSSELNEDSIVEIADLITQNIAYSFSVKEDQCGFLGDGTSTYGGIRGLAGSLAAGSKVTATGRVTFGALTFEDFESVIGKAKMWPGASPKWYVSNAGWAASMQRLQNAAGGNTMMDLAAGGVPTFMGYPVVRSQVLESRLTGTTTATALYFGDLALGCYMGTRRGVSLTLDQSRYFEYDAAAIRGTQRFDIVVHDVGTASDSGGIIALVFG